MISILWVSCLYPWLLSALWTSQSYSRSAAYYSFENKLSMSGHWTLESPGHWHQSHHPSGQPPLESRTQSGPGAQTGNLWLSELPVWVGGVSVTVSDIMMKWVSSPNLHVQAGHQGGHGQPGQCPCVLCQFSQPHTASCAQENGDWYHYQIIGLACNWSFVKRSRRHFTVLQTWNDVVALARTELLWRRYKVVVSFSSQNSSFNFKK